MNTPVINMAEHFDVDATLEAVTRERFAMPPAVIAAFRQSAMKSVGHLLTLVEDTKRFEKLKITDQLKIMEMVFDRAYGRSETASTSMTALHKTGQLEVGSNHGKQLETIEQRMKLRDRQFPELKRAHQARRRELSDNRATNSDSSITVDEEGADIVQFKGSLNG